MRYLITILCLISVGNSSFSQAYMGTTNTGDVFIGGSTESLRKQEGSGILEKYYLSEEWMPGKVVLKNNATHSVGKIRFNIAYNELEVYMNSSGAITYFDASMISGFWLGQRYFKGYNVFGTSHLFLEVLLEGELSVLSYIEYKFKKGDHNPVLGVGDKDGYVVSKTLFVNKKGVGIASIKKQKQLMTYIDEINKEIVMEYMKTNKLKVYRTENLIEIASYYNDLYSATDH